MGFRFRKRIKLFPGVWFNVSKSGVSTSIGGKGLTVNLKGNKAKTTANIPGTGLSYTETSNATPEPLEAQAPRRATIPALVWLLIFVVIALLLTVK